MTLSAQTALAAYVTSCTHEAIPEGARDIARQSLLDTLAVALAGRHEQVVARTATYVQSMRDGAGAPDWLSGARYTTEAAALRNAVSAHALDYDDVTPAWRGHPGAVIWPALFAAAHARAVSHDDLLDAFVIGFEVGAQIGSGITEHHYGSGWHATATIGVIAASAACARILGLDADRTFYAIGLAAAQSAGMQVQFGSMAKPLQAGFAAAAAVRAVLLAAAGVESRDALEGKTGFSGIYGARARLALNLPSRAAPAMAINRSGIEVKQFPNCYASHRAVEAALGLRAHLGVDVHGIRAISIEGSPAAHQPLLARLPTSVDESRFSAEYGVACALLDGRVQLPSFTEHSLQRPAIKRLMSVSAVSETGALGPERAARVTVSLADGRALEQSVTNLPGTFGDAAFMQRLREKVNDCMKQAHLGDCAQQLSDAVLSRAGIAPGSLGHWPVMSQVWRELETSRRA